MNYGNSRGAYAARRTTGVQYVPREEVEKPKLSLVKVEIGGTLANSVFTTILFVVVIAGFLGVMLLNIAVSSLSIRATDLENQISKLNQDSQALTVQMEEKGSVILQEASKMGMILRDKTVVVNFDNNNISNYQLTKEEADRAYEASVQH